jgi:hypothetical protein
MVAADESGHFLDGRYNFLHILLTYKRETLRGLSFE